MIRIAVRDPGQGFAGAVPRRRFGLDAPLPADPGVIERAVLRYLDEKHPSILVLAVRRSAAEVDQSGRIDLARGVPDLLLLLPGGRVACLKIKTQAQTLSRAQKAFRDLCAAQAIPFHVVRSLPEARAAIGRLAEGGFCDG